MGRDLAVHLPALAMVVLPPAALRAEGDDVVGKEPLRRNSSNVFAYANPRA